MNYATSSGEKTSSSAILAMPGALRSVSVTADNTNQATVIIYDNASAASGTILARIIVDAGLVYETFIPPTPIVALNGLYASISGTGAACVVHYTIG